MAEDLQQLVEARFGPTAPRVAGAGATGGDGGGSGSPVARLLLGHRTHRRYADRPVDPALLDLLFACAFSAPSKSDLQQAGVVRVRDPALRAEIAALIPSMPWIAAAPEFMVFIGDGRRIRAICAARGKPFANDHLDAFFNPAVDAGLALANFIAAAEGEGLGCCPISAVRNHAERIGALLALPAHVFPVAGLCLGWPAREGFISSRLPLDASVHVDRYDDAGMPARVDEYDRRRDGIHAIPPDAHRLVDRYGTAAFYGWSEDKARQVSLSEREDFGAYVRSQGFRLD